MSGQKNSLHISTQGRLCSTRQPTQHPSWKQHLGPLCIGGCALLSLASEPPPQHNAPRKVHTPAPPPRGCRETGLSCPAHTAPYWGLKSYSLLMASFSSLLLNILYVRYPDVNETEGVCSLFCVSSTLSAGMLFLPCISRYSVVGAISGYTVYMALNQPPDLSQRHEHSPGDTDTVFMP